MNSLKAINKKSILVDNERESVSVFGEVVVLIILIASGFQGSTD